MAKILRKYKNGNCKVIIKDDGTKTREFEGKPVPILPESIDLKITNHCDNRTNDCVKWCHEKSHSRGKHADKKDIFSIIDQMIPGSELAIGGGDPLSHPYLNAILEHAESARVICNLTININKLMDSKNCAMLFSFQKSGLIHGLGLSSVSSCLPPFFDDVMDCESIWNHVINKNSVFHFIAGISSYRDIMATNNDQKILILGYKKFGNGAKCFSKKMQHRINELKYFLGTLLEHRKVSFDNLAIEQLGVKSRVSKKFWDRHYMGDDGQFTMYIDCVKNEYARSSISKRKKIGELTLEEMFKDVKDSK